MRRGVFLGSGGGQTTAALLPYFRRGGILHAVDADPLAALYGTASVNAAVQDAVRAGQPPHGLVYNEKVDFLRYSFPADGTVDLFVSGSLGFVPRRDARELLERAARALAPGGFMTLELWGPQHAVGNADRHYTQQQITGLLNSLGLEVLSIEQSVTEARFTSGLRTADEIRVIARRRPTQTE